MSIVQNADVKFLTPAEAAELLRIQRDTVYRLIEAGDLPARRIGGQWRIPKAELDEMLNKENA